MSTGPIEFLGERDKRDLPATEYGGVGGLVQPETVAGLAGHTPSSSEARGMIVRAEAGVKSVVDKVTGIVHAVFDESGDAVDPVTGRAVNLAKLGIEEPKEGGQPVDHPLKTEPPG